MLEFEENIKKQLAETVKKQVEEQIHARLGQFDKQLISPKQVNNINNVNNFLQVVCVGPTDNYLDILTQQWGYDLAINFVKDCALSNLTGDIKLIEKIYFDERDIHSHPIVFFDKKIVSFIDEKKQIIKDPYGHRLSQRLSNNYLFKKKVCQKPEQL